MRVLLAVEESAGAQALQLVADRGHDVVGVLTGGHRVGAAAGDDRAAKLAGTLGVPVLDPRRVRDPLFAGWVRERGVDLLLNVHSLHIAHADVVDAPALGSFNLHPGPLPRYSGLNAPSWAIFHGESRHAVTLHWMSGQVDAGPIAYEAWFEVGPRDTGLRVATACVRRGVPLVGRLLDAAARGVAHIPATPQDLRGRQWFGRDAPYGGEMPWQLPARQVVDLVRAANYVPFRSPWGWPRTMLAGAEDTCVEVVRVTLTGRLAEAAPGTVGMAEDDGSVPVAAGDEWVLVQRVRVFDAAAVPAELLVPGGRCLPGPAVPAGGVVVAATPTT